MEAESFSGINKILTLSSTCSIDDLSRPWDVQGVDSKHLPIISQYLSISSLWYTTAAKVALSLCRLFALWMWEKPKYFCNLLIFYNILLQSLWMGNILISCVTLLLKICAPSCFMSSWRGSFSSYSLPFFTHISKSFHTVGGEMLKTSVRWTVQQTSAAWFCFFYFLL